MMVIIIDKYIKYKNFIKILIIKLSVFYKDINYKTVCNCNYIII